METFAFWRTQEARFSNGRPPSRRLTAMLAFDSTVEEYLAGEGEKLISVGLANEAYPLDAIALWARRIARIGGWLVDGQHVARWIISGGPGNDRHELKVLIDKFRTEASIAARASAVVSADASDDEAVDCWLDSIARSDSPFNVDVGWIENLADASAGHCAKLAARAYAVNTHVAATSLPPSPPPTELMPAEAIHETRSSVNAHDVTPIGPTQHGNSSAVTPTAAEPPSVLSWEAVEIVFVSDYTFQPIINGRRQQPVNFVEYGFDDRRRSGTPRKAWTVFRELADSAGVLATTANAEDWRDYEKRMQEIRASLKKWFKITGNPLPYRDGAYRTAFKIGLCEPNDARRPIDPLDDSPIGESIDSAWAERRRLRQITR